MRAGSGVAVVIFRAGETGYSGDSGETAVAVVLDVGFCVFDAWDWIGADERLKAFEGFLGEGCGVDTSIGEGAKGLGFCNSKLKLNSIGAGRTFEKRYFCKLKSPHPCNKTALKIATNQTRKAYKCLSSMRGRKFKNT